MSLANTYSSGFTSFHWGINAENLTTAFEQMRKDFNFAKKNVRKIHENDFPKAWDYRINLFPNGLGGVKFHERDGWYWEWNLIAWRRRYYTKDSSISIKYFPCALKHYDDVFLVEKNLSEITRDSILAIRSYGDHSFLETINAEVCLVNLAVSSIIDSMRQDPINSFIKAAKRKADRSPTP